jgi:hypothetical protein
VSARSATTAKATPLPALLCSPRSTPRTVRECNGERICPCAIARWDAFVLSTGIRQEVP